MFTNCSHVEVWNFIDRGQFIFFFIEQGMGSWTVCIIHLTILCCEVQILLKGSSFKTVCLSHWKFCFVLTTVGRHFMAYFMYLSEKKISFFFLLSSVRILTQEAKVLCRLKGVSVFAWSSSVSGVEFQIFSFCIQNYLSYLMLNWFVYGDTWFEKRNSKLQGKHEKLGFYSLLENVYSMPWNFSCV